MIGKIRESLPVLNRDGLKSQSYPNPILNILSIVTLSPAKNWRLAILKYIRVIVLKIYGQIF